MHYGWAFAPRNNTLARVGRKKDSEVKTEQLFEPDEVAPAIPVRQVRNRIWTRNKALLIQRYLHYFVKVTGHGTYVDGFAAPQREDEFDSWSAKRVIEDQPTDRRRKRLRHFHLFEIDPRRFGFLEQLQEERSKQDIHIYLGDFNQRVHEILRPDVISEKEATFVLLDQYAFECDWETVEALATYQSPRPYKLELFYFLCNWWFNRSVSMNLSGKRRWWGRNDADEFFRITDGVERAAQMTARFKKLGYRDVKPWAIYTRTTGPSVAYYMIHATDHPRGPKLMRTAYEDAVRPPRTDVQLRMVLEEPSDATDSRP